MEIIKNIALSIVFLIMLSAISIAQENLVSNPSFETIYGCPTGGNQIDSAMGWNTPINGGGGNPDLYHVCCTLPPVCGVPSQTFLHTFQYPHNGNGYVGIDAAISYSNDNGREYIQSRLLRRLSAGHTYCVKFYASLSDQSNAYIKPLGAYFDNGSISAPAPLGLAIATPQVYNTIQPLNDTINWMMIEGSFVATGNEEYITIGNFFSNLSSDIGLFGSPTNWWAYYYIDDVSVIDASLSAFAGKDTVIYPRDSVFIGRQPEIGLDEDCIWRVGELNIDTIAGMWVKPDSTTTYILQQTICGNVSYDTVTVHVWYAGIEDYANSKGITIFPNPAFQTLTISGKTEITQLIITDMLGNVVIQQQSHEHAATIDVGSLANGFYFIKAVIDKGFVVRKFVKE